MIWEHEMNEGRIALLCHNYDLAEESFRLALHALPYDDINEIWDNFVPKTLVLLGETLFLKKNFAEAKDCLEQAEKYYRNHFSDDTYSKAITNYCLAEITLWYGNKEEAIRYFGSAAPNLECLFHPEHKYRRRTAEMLGPDREIESIDSLEFAQRCASDFIAGLAVSELHAKVTDCKGAILDWIQCADESYAKATPHGIFEAYISLNNALALTTCSGSHFDMDYESILAGMAEIAIVLRCDQLAAELSHALVTFHVAKNGDDSCLTAKAKGLLATVYAQQGRLQVAESIFESAFRTLEREKLSAEMIMPEALSIYEKLTSYRSCLQFADSMIGEASGHFEQGKLRQARRCLEKAKGRMTSVFPVHGEQFLPVQQCLLEVYKRLGIDRLVLKTKKEIALIEQQRQERHRQQRATMDQLPSLAVWIDQAA